MLGFAVGLILSIASATPAQTTTVQIDPTVTWGVWEGWGTSLCWWANVFGQDTNLADLIFTLNNGSINGQRLPGLGLSIARYNVGGSSHAPAHGSYMVSSPNIPSWKQIGAYWTDWNSSDPSSKSWNWTADVNQLTMAKMAVSRNATVELFSNSPVWWMCENHNPSGANNGANNNLQPWNYRQHAVYMATVTEYAAMTWGIRFESVEPFNEPVTDWWKASGTQEGCHFDRSTQATVAVMLREELDARGLNATLVATSDENTYDLALATWQSFNATVRKSVGQVNTHGYQQGGGRRDLLYDAVVKQDGKKLWNSEYGEGDDTGASLASNLHLDFKWLHNTAWVYWQVFDGLGWGLIKVDENAKTFQKVNNKYFVLCQYSRHIRAGHVIINTNDDNTIAAYDDTLKELVIVVKNPGKDEQIVSFDLSKFVIMDKKAAVWSTELSGSGPQYSQASCSILNGGIQLTLSSNTIYTIVFSAKKN